VTPVHGTWFAAPLAMLGLSEKARAASLKLCAESLREAGTLWLTFGVLEGVLRGGGRPWGSWWFPVIVFVGVFLSVSGAIMAAKFQEGGTAQ
jgi:hypothetical protein